MTGGRAVDIAPCAHQDSGTSGRTRPANCGGAGQSDGMSSTLQAWLVGAAMLLSGCAALPGGGPPPLDTYELSAPAVTPAGPTRSRVQVLVAEPTALKALDGENVVIKTAPNAIEFLSGAQWADRLPRVVQARMVEALQGTGRLGGVGKPGEGLAIDYQLVSEIRSFEVRVDGSPRAEIEIHIKLLNDRNGVVRASRSFAASVPTGGTGNAAFVAALDAAFAQVVDETVRWTLTSI
jgi:cholesterol transport system auxiliary component